MHMPSADFRGVVLSGGGAKGAYGAGFLAALEAADQYSDDPPKRFYSGSSVGALNAVMAAQGDIDELIDIYKKRSSKNILGYNTKWIKTRWFFKSIWSHISGKKFYTYENEYFKDFLNERIDFNKLRKKDVHFTISATDYVTGNMDTFYMSNLIDEFKKYEEGDDPNSKRLQNYHRIDSKEKLVKSLLASSAFPTVFPPVRMGDRLYVDGGVGNNMPTPQAAYFGRFLKDVEDKNLGRVYCNVLNPERITEDDEEITAFKLTLRVFQLFQNKIQKDNLVSWSQINRNQKKLKSQKEKITGAVEEADISNEDEDRIRSKIEEIDPSTSSTERIEMELREVRPSSNFSLRHIFDFDPEKLEDIVDDGYVDCIRKIEEDGLLKEAQADQLRNDPNYGLS